MSVAGVLTVWAGDVQPARADVKPGWVALVIVLVLCVVTVLLWLNMRKQLGKIRFEEQETPPRRARRRGGEGPTT